MEKKTKSFGGKTMRILMEPKKDEIKPSLLAGKKGCAFKWSLILNQK